MSDFESRLEATLKGVRDEHVQSIASEIPAARQQVLLKVRRRQFRFVVTSSAVTAAALVAVLLVTQAKPIVSDDALPPASGGPVVIATTELDGTPVDIAAGFGSAWVTSRTDSVAILSRVEGDGSMGSGYAGGGGGGDLWHVALNDEYVYLSEANPPALQRIDPSDSPGDPVTIPVDTASPDRIAATDEVVVYSANTEGGTSVTPVDAQTLRPVGEVGTITEGFVSQLAADKDGVWAILENREEDQLWHISNREGVADQLLPITLSGTASGLAIHGSVAWIAQQTDSTGSLKRVDVSGDASGQVDDRVGGDLRDIASGDEGIWLLLTDETSNAAYEIDPQTGELLHRIETGSRGDGQIAVADGYVWVTNVEDKTLLQIDPDGSPTPIPSETPTDEETKDASPQPAEEADCTDIPFASLTGTMGLGSGANVGESLQGHEASNVVLHYSLSHGAFVDVVVGNPDYATGDPSEAFDVLGSEAILSEIKDGYMVTFGYKSCPFALLGYGMARAAVKEFAADLLFEGDPDMHNDAWALWPEPDPEQAYQTCLDSSGSDAGTGTELDEQQRELQARLESTAFVNDVLGWPGDSSMERDKGLEGGYGDDFVALIVTGPAGNRMEIVLRETVPGCWSVVSLNPADEVFTGASLSKQAGVLHVGFDPDSQNIKGDLDHMTIETASGSGIERRRLSIEEFKAGSPLTVGFERSGPSYFMILFQDAAGKVLNAKGYALPSGDVVAG